MLDVEIDAVRQDRARDGRQLVVARVLDEAALDAVRAVSRVPFPPGVPPRRLLVRLPVVFEIR